jgi:hypothetical protein
MIGQLFLLLSFTGGAEKEKKKKTVENPRKTTMKQKRKIEKTRNTKE